MSSASVVSLVTGTATDRFVPVKLAAAALSFLLLDPAGDSTSFASDLVFIEGQTSAFSSVSPGIVLPALPTCCQKPYNELPTPHITTIFKPGTISTDRVN